MNKKKLSKNFILDLICDIVGSIAYAIGLYTFARTADFAPGGVSGLALICNHLWNAFWIFGNCLEKNVISLYKQEVQT